ncbi:hypothetical protein [Alienimonas californiensis]|uniref:DUF5666 domain-containing protein n=1 Tax=Alienimonas californiensis TaxID=2527989 RepID=A0A517P530_9PLAN|nr:hypothetical protein [Alienimonas californiensis]QDT14456.1 hypothetical protein CA12_05290 [Alienimonas californiensis]
MKTRNLTLTAAALALAVGAAPLLTAQERPTRRQAADRSQPQAGERLQTGERMRDGKGKPTDRGTPQHAAVLKPTGFISVGADYDGDGRIDAVETIYALDYVAARDASRQRMDRASQRPRKVDGELTNLRKIELSGYGGPHMVGRVRTDRGTVAKVDFGPAAQVEELKLTEGDRVDVEGRRGRINDRAMLLASKVSSDGNTVQIDRPKPSGLRRVKGEITGLKNVRFRGFGDQSVIADMRLVSGREVTVNLGEKTKLAPLTLEQGDEISLIARPGSLNDEPALIATLVYADGQTADVDARGERERNNMNRDDQSRNNVERGNANRNRGNALRPRN